MFAAFSYLEFPSEDNIKPKELAKLSQASTGIYQFQDDGYFTCHMAMIL